MKKLQTQRMMTSLALTFLWTAALLSVVPTGAAVLLFAAKSSLPAPLVAALLAAMVLLTIRRQQSRDRARRHQAALGAYAARELARVARYGDDHRPTLAPVPVPVFSRNKTV